MTTTNLCRSWRYDAAASGHNGTDTYIDTSGTHIAEVRECTIGTLEYIVTFVHPQAGHQLAEALRFAAAAAEFIGEAESGNVDATDLRIHVLPSGVRMRMSTEAHRQLGSASVVVLRGDDAAAFVDAYFSER